MSFIDEEAKEDINTIMLKAEEEKRRTAVNDRIAFMRKLRSNNNNNDNEDEKKNKNRNLKSSRMFKK